MTVFLKKMLVRTNGRVKETNLFANKNRVRCSVNYLTVSYYRPDDDRPALTLMVNDYGEKSCSFNYYEDGILTKQIFVTPHADLHFFLLEYDAAISQILEKKTPIHGAT